jgi:hypothetical protein
MALTRKLQRTKKDQYTLTVPKSVVHLLKWNEQDLIEFGFEDGKITLKKHKKGEKHEK